MGVALLQRWTGEGRIRDNHVYDFGLEDKKEKGNTEVDFVVRPTCVSLFGSSGREGNKNKKP